MMHRDARGYESVNAKNDKTCRSFWDAVAIAILDLRINLRDTLWNDHSTNERL